MTPHVPTPQQAAILAAKASDLVTAINTEKNRPLVPGATVYRAKCRWCSAYMPPFRATKPGAQEDASTHMNSPGSHSISYEDHFYVGGRQETARERELVVDASVASAVRKKGR